MHSTLSLTEENRANEKSEKSSEGNCRKRYLSNSANKLNDSAFENTNIECINIQTNNNISECNLQNTKEHATQSPTFSIGSESAWMSLLQKVPCSVLNIILQILYKLK